MNIKTTTPCCFPVQIKSGKSVRYQQKEMKLTQVSSRIRQWEEDPLCHSNSEFRKIEFQFSHKEPKFSKVEEILSKSHIKSDGNESGQLLMYNRI